MSASAEGNETDPNLTPLLDVVLQLIMFFMITVNFVRSRAPYRQGRAAGRPVRHTSG